MNINEIAAIERLAKLKRIIQFFKEERIYRISI
jgi:hypothetical protein